MNPLKYILYCRKSTESDDRQVLSLDSQEKELLGLAEKLQINVVKVLRESKSAKALGRPVFDEMMKMFEIGKADGILCWKVDRLTRNPVDSGTIQWLLQNNKIKQIQTFERNFLPSDNVLLMSIEQAMASQYIRDLSSNIKRGNRAKLEKGEWPNSAPFGYKNDNKKIIVDEYKAKYVVRAFEFYSTGSYSFKEISNILFKEGLRASTGRKFFSGNIHRFIDNPFYCGLMQRDGKLYLGNHTPLISKDLFDTTQNVLHNRHRPRPQNHFFPLRGFMTCENCGCALTASLKKGHHYYYCTNGKGICTEHKTYLRENTLYPIVASLFEKLNLDEEVIELLYESAKEETEHEIGYSESVLETLKTRLSALTVKESRLLDTLCLKAMYRKMYTTLKPLKFRTRKPLSQSKFPILNTSTHPCFLLWNRPKKFFYEQVEPKKSFWPVMMSKREK